MAWLSELSFTLSYCFYCFDIVFQCWQLTRVWTRLWAKCVRGTFLYIPRDKRESHKLLLLPNYLDLLRIIICMCVVLRALFLSFLHTMDWMVRNLEEKKDVQYSFSDNNKLLQWSKRRFSEEGRRKTFCFTHNFSGHHIPH